LFLQGQLMDGGHCGEAGSTLQETFAAAAVYLARAIVRAGAFNEQKLEAKDRQPGRDRAGSCRFGHTGNADYRSWPMEPPPYPDRGNGNLHDQRGRRASSQGAGYANRAEAAT
jgi:hypothetical protein